MPMKKKKFIDKKNSVTFRLVHRSQKDPLAADESAPQHVLLEYGKVSVDKAKQKEEEHKFGVYYDDDYNYLQHLRDVKEVYDWEPVVDKAKPLLGPIEEPEPHSPDHKTVSFNLPSSVFQSRVEETEGMLNKAAPSTGPRPDWDPDIVAALDDDFDFDNSDNEIEDNFMAIANASCSEEEEDSSSDSGSDSSDADSEASFGTEENKSRFTNYSMSSSVLPRSENLQALDEHFEKFFEKYDEEEIGALDCEDIQGYIKPDSEIIQQLVKEFTENQEKGKLKDLIQPQNQHQSQEECETSSEEEFMDITIQEKPTEKWDCESFISNFSTTSNRPRLIIEPKKLRPIEVSSRSGLPKDTLQVKGLTQQLLKRLNKDGMGDVTQQPSVSSRMSVASTIRAKNETPEERRERKAVIKQMRKERRAEKKANKAAFKEEQKRQEKALLNLQQNMKGIKML